MGLRRILWGPWLIIVVAWPATLLGWYYITLAADPSWLRDRFLLGYLVALLVVDSVLCLVILPRITARTRGALRAGAALELDLARGAWHEALRLPQRTALLICGLIALTAVPISGHLLWVGEPLLVLHGWIAASIVGACELTLLFPLVQATTLPFLRNLKARFPDLRLTEAGAPSPPQRAYFTLSLAATGLVAAALVARLIMLRATPLAEGANTFSQGGAIALAVICFAAMFGGIGLHLYLSVLLPLRALAAAMTRFASGRAVTPLGLAHVGEIGILAQHFDDMVAALERSRLDLVEKEALLRQAQRFDAMGLMAASLVHEMTNPLAGVRMNLRLAIDSIGEIVSRPRCPRELPPAHEQLMGVRVATDLMGSLLNDLKSFGRRDGGERDHCQLAAACEMALRIVRTEVPDCVSIERQFGPAPPVLGSSMKLTQVFVNLLLNALQAMPPDRGGKIVIGVARGSATVDAWVADTGRGVSPAARERLFRAMNTGQNANGSGLGLYVCRNIVAAHGGEIDYLPNPEGGSVFRVRLPAAAAET